jgi:hypothetical protein
LILPELEIRPLRRPARSQSLHRPCYLDSCFPSSTFNVSLEYAIRKVQKTQIVVKCNATHQFLVYADDLNLLGEILWPNHPMRELLKFRNLETRMRYNSGALSRLASPPFIPLAPHRVLLGYAVTTGSRNSKEGPRDLRNVTRNNTQRCVLRMSDSSVYKRD